MKKYFLILSSIFVISSLFFSSQASGADIPAKYPRLFQSLSGMNPGDIVNLADLGIRIDYKEENIYREPGSCYIIFPRDLDIKCTEDAPYRKDFPGLHLNLPLLPENSPTTYLVMSDQPESLKVDNEYLEGKGSGIDGLYGKATAPAGKRMRFLADHYNQSGQTKWLKVFMTSKEDTTINIHKKGSSVAGDTIVAGSIADQISHQVTVSDIREIRADTPTLLGQWGPVKNEDTAVVLYEMTPGKDVTFWTVITDENTLNSPSTADLEALPKLKSSRWRDREEKLRTLVKKDRFPSRYNRVLECFIHARGLFQFPDRYCTSSYDYIRNNQWVQVYSPFEYTDGVDELTVDGNPVNTNNRGNYGCYIRTNIKLKSLPEGVHNVAVVMINTSDTLGGIFKATLNRTTGTSFVFSKASLSNEIVTQKKAVLLWRGEAAAGDELDVQFFTLANTSVRPWYLVIPMP
ncbi:MAG: hypothetical protein AB2L14_32845 [Candidatus Xenobiia bacterium LiM19]